MFIPMLLAGLLATQAPMPQSAPGAGADSVAGAIEAGGDETFVRDLPVAAAQGAWQHHRQFAKGFRIHGELAGKVTIDAFWNADAAKVITSSRFDRGLEMTDPNDRSVRIVKWTRFNTSAAAGVHKIVVDAIAALEYTDPKTHRVSKFTRHFTNFIQGVGASY